MKISFKAQEYYFNPSTIQSFKDLNKNTASFPKFDHIDDKIISSIESNLFIKNAAKYISDKDKLFI